MNKQDLVTEVAKATCSKAEAKKALDAVLGAIKKSLKKGESVTLVGFGTFSVTKELPGRGETPRPASQSRLRPRRFPSSLPARH